MGLIDFILNLAGLLLWLSWRSVQYDPLTRRTPATLLGTLRPAEKTRWRQWHLPAAIIGLLIARAVGYWLIGSSMNWVGRLDLGVISVPIAIHGRWSDLFTSIMLYSFLSFGIALGVVYLWLMLLSILAGPDPVHRLVRVQLGVVDQWPCWLKLLLPGVVTAIGWWLATWLFANLTVGNYSSTHYLPSPVSATERLEAALLVGLGSYTVWKYVVAGLLVLHLLSTYVYFGKHPFWKYVDATARTLLWPLRNVPLRVGKADFAPVVGIALTFLAAELMQGGLIALYRRLP
jgi:uncharacterized protein YggT (Ycf19 family)